MKVRVEELSQPVKITILEDSESLKVRKKKVFDKIKGSLDVKGFRKGHVPQEVAEKRFDLGQMYKPLFDELYLEAKADYNIVSARDFEIYGDLADSSSPVTMIFVAEVKPTVKLPNFDNLTIEYKEPVVTEEEMEGVVTALLNSKAVLEIADKDELENLDIAIIDYEGVLEGDSKPFVGGTAKDYSLTVDVDNRTFIDTFEEQIIGMKRGETKKVTVTFPEDYGKPQLANKKATFVVKLKEIKRKIVPELTEEFVKENTEYETVDDYLRESREKYTESKKKSCDDDFKKTIVARIIDSSEMSPIPTDMVDNELRKQWNAFLRRIGKTEEEYLEENPNGKEIFDNKTREHAANVVKTVLVLEQITEEHEIEATKEEVVEYVKGLSILLGYDEKTKEKIMSKLDTDKQEYELQERATLNDKTIEFLVNRFR